MITGIIMASGFASRMNKEKLLLEIDGIRIIERVIKAVKTSMVDEIIMVCRKEELMKLGEEYGIKIILNERAEKGQSESIKLGVKAANNKSQGYMFFVGDQPFINSQSINKLIHEFNKGKNPIIIPKYKGKRGTPTIFSYKLKSKLLNLEGDIGGRSIIKEMIDCVRFINISKDYIGLDVDTIEEYERLKERS